MQLSNLPHDGPLVRHSLTNINCAERAGSSSAVGALILLTDDQAAEALGISVRKFHELRAKPWMPVPIVLGPRMLRWVRAELEQAIVAMPRQQTRVEPEALQKAREVRVTKVRDGKKVQA